jgi:hypothetical protein
MAAAATKQPRALASTRDPVTPEPVTPAPLPFRAKSGEAWVAVQRVIRGVGGGDVGWVGARVWGARSRSRLLAACCVGRLARVRVVAVLCAWCLFC